MSRKLNIRTEPGKKGPLDEKVFVRGKAPKYEEMLKVMTKFPPQLAEFVLSFTKMAVIEERNYSKWKNKKLKGGDFILEIAEEVYEMGKLTDYHRRKLTEKSNG
tara:strand:+ start:806 stop:1117 length:312 start_codon:yes stop_codon:yes gene_type:complete